ncbi:MAG: alpha/beta fold hydrolase [Bacteroidia bacterium]|nr:alpha/beta fold hydrolase [Bacteroidia bacterium]
MKLYFRKYGEGPAVIILHGLFGQSDNWNSIARRIGESGFTALPADLRNHGLSPQSEEWDYRMMAEDVAQLIIDNDLESVHLIGHSMGGKAAMQLCLLHPGLVEKMIICDIAPKAYPRQHDDVLNVLLNAPLSSFDSRKEAETYMLGAVPDAGVAQFLLKNIYRSEAGVFAWRFNLPVIARHYAAVTVAIAGPPVNNRVLFLRGDRSSYVRDEDFRDALRLFPNARLETISNSGHWIHAEQPEAFFHSAMRFLNEPVH